MSAMILIKLTEQLVAVILTEWLEIRDISRLDKAVCQHSVRRSFVNVAFSPFCVYASRPIISEMESDADSSKDACRGLLLLKWALLRGARIADILVTDNEVWADFCAQLVLYLQEFGEHVTLVAYRNSNTGDFNMAMFREIGRCCGKVTSLLCSDNMPMEATEEIGNYWPHLQSIEIGTDTSNEALASIGQHCQHLNSLRVRVHHWDTSVEPDWQALLNSRGVTLRSIYGHVNAPSVGGWRNLAVRCPHLRILELLVDDDDFDELPELQQHCRELQEVRVVCYASSDAAIAAVALFGTRLKFLKTSDEGSDIPFIALFKACPKLQGVDATEFSQLSPQFLVAMGAQCHDLEQLDLDYTNEKAVNDESVGAIAAGCPKMKHICLSGSEITDAGLINLLTHCKKLESVVVNSCKGITNTSLCLLPHLCPGLQHLQVGNCTITIAGISSVARRCRKLRSIAVSQRLEADTVQAVETSGLFRPGLQVQGLAF